MTDHVQLKLVQISLIALLKQAGIRVWVLTGDKVETAINIAKSAKLLTDDMFLVKLPVWAPRPCSCLRCPSRHRRAA